MRAFFSQAMPDNPLNLVLLLSFTALFLAVAIWNCWPSRRKTQEKASRLPLED
jgi:cbb3-type cytochrome oxidase subunit 3